MPTRLDRKACWASSRRPAKEKVASTVSPGVGIMSAKGIDDRSGRKVSKADVVDCRAPRVQPWLVSMALITPSWTFSVTSSAFMVCLSVGVSRSGVAVGVLLSVCRRWTGDGANRWGVLTGPARSGPAPPRSSGGVRFPDGSVRTVARPTATAAQSDHCSHHEPGCDSAPANHSSGSDPRTGPRETLILGLPGGLTRLWIWPERDRANWLVPPSSWVVA